MISKVAETWIDCAREKAETALLLGLWSNAWETLQALRRHLWVLRARGLLDEGAVREAHEEIGGLEKSVLAGDASLAPGTSAR